MKKVLVFLLAVLFCLPACFPAFADMGGPEMIGYTATVKTDADYYDWDWNESTDESLFIKKGVIPAGTVLQISNEYTESGVSYGYFYNAESFDGKSGYVRTNDLDLGVRSVYPKEQGYMQSISVHLRVTEPKGVILYAGPSLTYAKVATVPYGTELTTNTLDQSRYDIGAWMYLEYGGKGGWADCWLYNGTYCPMAELLPNGESGTVWVVKDNAELCDKAGKAILTVPKGEKLTFTAFNRSPHTISYYVSYQGKEGVFSINDDGYDNTVASNKNQFIYKDDMKVKQGFLASVFAYPDDRLPKGTVRFARGDTVDHEFVYYAEPREDYRGGVEWYYVEKDGQKGWIKLDHSKIEERDWQQLEPQLPSISESKVIRQPETTTAPVSTTVIETTTQQTTQTVADITETTSASAAESTEEQVSYAQFERTEPTSDVVAAMPTRRSSPVGIVAVCVAVAAGLTLTSLVTLSLIRRKKESD